MCIRDSSKIINIEALTMLEMARKQLLPAVNAYMVRASMLMILE